MTQIDYYFSTISPFTYLAQDGLEQLAARQGARIAYKPLDIFALFGRTGGVPVKERHENRQVYRLQELRRGAKKAGVTLNMPAAFWPTNAAPSSYAVIAAAKEDGGDTGALVRGLLNACFAEEKNIAEDEVIRECLSAAGFRPDLADKGMLSAAETYAANLEDAVTAGVFGAPFYIVGDERFWGHDRLADLELHLQGKI
ncbi:MAG: 2-hydroxychromene-2-carboxylate isomerase [Rhodobacteraceae bacterium]|nr:2-hydroxychromene-2-carboxylate isomerase [Paracoccaceae bacterium]